MRIFPRDDGCLGNDDQVIELGPDAPAHSRTPRNLQSDRRCLANIAGPHPEQQADDGALRLASALVGSDLSPSKRPTVVDELRAEGIDGGTGPIPTAVVGEEIDADSPQLPNDAGYAHRVSVARRRGGWHHVPGVAGW